MLCSSPIFISSCSSSTVLLVKRPRFSTNHLVTKGSLAQLSTVALAVPVLLEIGRESVLGGTAEDELLDMAAQDLIEEATRLT